MVKIINDPYASLGGGFAHALGSGLQQGLGSGLQALAQLKMNQLQQRHQVAKAQSAYEAMGFSPEEAAGLAQSPEAIQKTLLSNFWQRGGAPIGNDNIPQVGGMDQSQQQVGQSEASQMPSGQQLQGGMQSLQGLAPIDLAKSFSGLGVTTPREATLAQPKETEAALSDQPEITSLPTAKEIKSSNPNKPRSIRDILSQMPREEVRKDRLLAIKEATLQHNIEQAQIKRDHADQQEINKETSKYYEEIQQQNRGARNDNRRLNRMKELIQKGDMTNPALFSFLNTLDRGIWGLGINLKSLTNPDSEEFDKLSADFIKGAKDIFGSRITDADLKAFLSTIPNLMQSNEGKMRLINTLGLANEGKFYRSEIAEKIIEDNGGKRPRNFEKRVDDATEEFMDQQAGKYKELLKQPVTSTKSFTRSIHESFMPSWLPAAGIYK